jgi:hypothetical protein
MRFTHTPSRRRSSSQGRASVGDCARETNRTWRAPRGSNYDAMAQAAAIKLKPNWERIEITEEVTLLWRVRTARRRE